MDLNLFNPLYPDSQLHKNYKRLLMPEYASAREIINQWAENFVDRDNKIVKEFQTTFNSSFWELYLFACFKELNYKIDFSYISPDFIISSITKKYAIEAVIANNAIDSLEEWNTDYLNFTSEMPIPENLIDIATIRLANSIESKLKKFRENYSMFPHIKNIPFILAIAPFEQPFFYMQQDRAIVRVLYGYEGEVFEDDEQKKVRTVLGHKYIDEIIKSNGKKIPLGYFTDRRAEEISGVIFSSTATFGKVRALSELDCDTSKLYFTSLHYRNPGIELIKKISKKSEYKESLLDGLTIFHNPFAKKKIDLDFLNNSDISHCYFDVTKRTPILFRKDGFLMFRSVIRMSQFFDGA